MDRIVRVRADRTSGRSSGDLVDSVQPGNFFDEIDFRLQVRTPGRDFENRSVAIARWMGCSARSQPEALKVIGLRFGRYLNPKQRIRSGRPQSDLPGITSARIVVDHPLNEHTTRGLQNQLRGPPAGPIANLNIGPPFEAVGGFGA